MRKSSRDYIIKQSAQLFNKQGVLGTTIADICKAIEMTKGSIYANFEDKNHLAIEVFKYNIKLLTGKFLAAINLKSNPHEKLMLALDWYENIFSDEEFAFGCPLANAAAEVDDTNPKLRKLVNIAIQDFVKIFDSLIKEAISKGHYKSSADREYAKFIVTSIEGALLVSKSTDNHQYLKNTCDEIRTKLSSWMKKINQSNLH
jgi:TetR/AcrR family transcriptional repressor of nem operon